MNNFSKLALILALAIAPATLATPAFAQSAGEARAAGLIGERPDGLVGAVTPEGEAVAERINAERRRVYEGIAGSSGQSLDQVMAVAGAKQIDKLKPGEYYYSGGRWVQK